MAYGREHHISHTPMPTTKCQTRRVNDKVKVSHDSSLHAKDLDMPNHWRQKTSCEKISVKQLRRKSLVTSRGVIRKVP